MYNAAVNTELTQGTLKVFGHGYYHNFGGLTRIEDIKGLFFRESRMWRQYINKGGKLNLLLKSCSTGDTRLGLTLGQTLTDNSPNLTVYAPRNYWYPSNRILNNDGYNVFSMGNVIDTIYKKL